MQNTQNIALQIEYLGANFFGFQKQINCRTIQEELEKALSQFANQSIQISTAGRTDTGVHALNQVINFTTTSTRELNGWVRGVNALLPADIRIKQSTIVADNFSARFDAISRTYYYYLYISPVYSAIWHKRVGWYHQSLDLEAMQTACENLIGEHDFSSFRAANCQANTPIRNMQEASMLVHGQIIRFKFSANAFLYHMIRNIVGALIYVGNAKLSIDESKQMFKAQDRTKAPPTFMPDGLYLADVKYQTPIFRNVDRYDWLGLPL